MRAPKKWGALVVGGAATVAAATVGLRLFSERLEAAASWHACAGASRTLMPSHATRRVTLDPTGLRYYEGANSLELTVEMASDRRGSYYIVYVWTPKAWIREMPEWCRYRREEILLEIKRLTADKRIDWVDED